MATYSNRSHTFSSRDKSLLPLFVYGTLMDPRTRDKVLEKKEGATKATLNGYKRKSYTTPEGPNYDTILEDPKQSVEGDILMVTNDELKELEHWEDQYILSNKKLDNGQHVCVFILKNKDKNE